MLWPKEKKYKGQTMIYKLKTLHRKLKIEQHELHKNRSEPRGAFNIVAARLRYVEQSY